MEKVSISNLSTINYCKDKDYQAILSFLTPIHEIEKPDLRFRLWGFNILEEIKKIILSIKEQKEICIIESHGLLLVKDTSGQESNLYTSHLKILYKRNKILKYTPVNSKIFIGKIQCFRIGIKGINIIMENNVDFEAECLNNSNFVEQSFCIIESYLYNKKIFIEFNHITKKIISIKHAEKINLNSNIILSNLKRYTYGLYTIAYIKTNNLNSWCAFPKHLRGFDCWDEIIGLKYNIHEEEEIKEMYYEMLLGNAITSVEELNNILKHTIQFHGNKEVKSILPKYYLDFTTKTCLYIKYKFKPSNKWKYEDFNFYHIIPEKDKYWIIDGVDYSKNNKQT